MAQKSDYWHNMYAALTADAVTKRTKGLVASIISAYDRHTEKKAEKERKEKTGSNEWAGEIKERLKKLKLHLLKEFVRDTDWGTTHILKFEDEAGRAFTWFASTGVDKDDEQWEEGKWYTGAATVKKHDTFRDEKQTIVTRASLKGVREKIPKTPAALRKHFEALYKAQGKAVSAAEWNDVTPALAKKFLPRLSFSALWDASAIIKWRFKDEKIIDLIYAELDKREAGKGEDIDQEVAGVVGRVKAGDITGLFKVLNDSTRLNPPEGVAQAMHNSDLREFIHALDSVFADRDNFNELPLEKRNVWHGWQKAALKAAEARALPLNRTL